MCYYKIDCDNFIASPHNDTVCAIYCYYNPRVEDSDVAPDMFVRGKGRRKILTKLYKKPEDVSIKREQIDDEDGIDNEMREADRLIEEMQKANLRVNPAEEEIIKDTEGELIDEAHRPQVRFPREKGDTVAQIMKQRQENKPTPTLSEEEKQVVQDSEQVHDEIKDEKELIAKIDAIAKDKPTHKCPHCGKEFKNVAVHLRFCKHKPKEGN